MSTTRKRVPRSRQESGLSGAEEMFVFGSTAKPVNKFEVDDLCRNRPEGFYDELVKMRKENFKSSIE
jgi:hypothetical protein